MKKPASKKSARRRPSFSGTALSSSKGVPRSHHGLITLPAVPRGGARVHPTGRIIQITPGQTIQERHPEEIERVAICDWIPQGDGTYKPVVRLHVKWVRLGEVVLRQLGLGVSYMTLSRLIRAGFVVGRLVAPKVMLFNLQSYYDHKDQCQDPEFWTGENLRKYKEAL